MINIYKDSSYIKSIVTKYLNIKINKKKQRFDILKDELKIFLSP